MLGKNKKKDKGKKGARDHGNVIRQQPQTGASVSNVAGVAEIHGRSGRATSEAWTPAPTEYTLPPSIGTPWAFSLLTFAREIDHLSRELLFKSVLCSFSACFLAIQTPPPQHAPSAPHVTLAAVLILFFTVSHCCGWITHIY
jgi:hypothetical protein